MLEELQRRNYSAETTRTYLFAVKDFATYFGKRPDLLRQEHLRQYQLHLLNDRKLTVDTIVGGFREFFVVVWPCEIFDVLRHVLVDVCLPVRIPATAGQNPSSQLENLRLKPAASPTAVRVPLSGTLHRATTSTRIPVLSPKPPASAAPSASFKSRYRKSAAI
jgi:hypothetical protein